MDIKDSGGITTEEMRRRNEDGRASVTSSSDAMIERSSQRGHVMFNTRRIY